MDGKDTEAWHVQWRNPSKWINLQEQPNNLISSVSPTSRRSRSYFVCSIGELENRPRLSVYLCATVQITKNTGCDIFVQLHNLFHSTADNVQQLFRPG